MVKYQGKTIANWQSLKSNRHISEMEKRFEQVFLGPKLGYNSSKYLGDDITRTE
jgi:hypothetical protein